MIKKRVTIIMLTLALCACSDTGKEDENSDDTRTLFQKALRQDSHKIGKTQDVGSPSEKTESAHDRPSQDRLACHDSASQANGGVRKAAGRPPNAGIAWS